MKPELMITNVYDTEEAIKVEVNDRYYVYIMENPKFYLFETKDEEKSKDRVTPIKKRKEVISFVISEEKVLHEYDWIPLEVPQFKREQGRGKGMKYKQKQKPIPHLRAKYLDEKYKKLLK